MLFSTKLLSVFKGISIITILLIIKLQGVTSVQGNFSYEGYEVNTYGPRANGKDCEYEVFNYLRCSSDSEAFDIKEQMNKVYHAIPNSFQRHFNQFKWSAPIVGGILPEGVFENFRLLQIEFNSSNLERVHWNAFKNPDMFMATTTWNHLGTTPTKLRNYPNSDYDLYLAFTKVYSFKNLYINLDWTSKHDIPDNAFINNRWDDFNQIVFNGQFVVSRIGDYLTYYLPKSLQKISFKGVVIEMISENAFRFQDCSQCNQVYIGLESTQLDENKVQTKVFDITGRPVLLHLENNNFKTLNEEIFSTFLSNNPRNQLFLDKNPLKCSPKQKPLFQWLLNNYGFKARVFNALCSDGIPIWDSDFTTEDDEEGPPSTSTIPPSFPTVGPPSNSGAPPASTSTIEPVVQLCNHDGRYDGQHGVKEWPPVPPGQYSIVNCSSGQGVIRWKCLDSLEFDKKGPDFEECWLDELLTRNITSVEEVVEIIEEVLEKTTNKDELNSMTSLGKVVEIVIKLENFIKKSSIDSIVAQNLSQSFVQLFSQTIDQSLAWNDGTDTQRVRTASQVLIHIQRTAFISNCYLSSENKSQEFVSNNLYEKIYFNLTESIRFEYNSSSITVPKPIDFKDIETNGYSCRENSSMGALINTLSDYLIHGLDDSLRINSQIIAFSLRDNEESQTLKDKTYVKIRLRHKTRLVLGDRMECRFWDYSSLRWSSEGCHHLFKESDRETTVCQCNHLTNFAAIMDLSGREDNDLSKHVLTLIFCSFSVISLMILIAFITRRQAILRLFGQTYKQKTNQITRQQMKKRDFIVINQSVCLLISDVIIIAFMDRTHQKVLCHITSFILLLSLLSSFVWMFINGVHLFRMTTDVFHRTVENRWLLLFGYGLPFLLALLGLIVVWPQSESFISALVGNDYFCWISSEKHSNNIWILIGPAIVCILMNVMIIGFLVYLVKKKKNSWRKQIMAFTLLSANLGITWCLFAAYMNRISQFFSYIFVVLNGSQGTLMLLYELAISIKTNPTK